MKIKPDGSSTDMVEVAPDGTISFGTGSGPFDAFLYRTAAGKLRVDSDLEVVGNVTATGFVGMSTLSAGQATVGALIANATATVTVTLRPGFKDTAYTAVAQVVGGANVLAALSIQSTTVASKSTVTVVVKNTGLVSLGGQVLVTAIHD
ncbi:hypothetical protein ACWDG9_04715 [Streptomyces sp. NPDC001073]